MERQSGVLLHPSSLPGNQICGTFGEHAFHFLDFLESSGLSIWQMLPLCPTHEDRSPYQALSVHAGNYLLIDLMEYVNRAWLSQEEVDNLSNKSITTHLSQKKILIEKLAIQFGSRASNQEKENFQHFCQQHYVWLKDFALFSCLKNTYPQSAWTHWPDEYKHRNKNALNTYEKQNPQAINTCFFEQYLFFSQFEKLKTAAKQKNILLFGDIPIFIAHDSVDVWAHQELFLLNDDGQPSFVAGVPPDYFSATGQRWGNPHYNWIEMEKTQYQWWVDRLQIQLTLFDTIRIDHFRGFDAYWEIPAKNETAIEGQWKPGPGGNFFHAMQKHFGQNLPFIAEDLGIITEEVTQLRQAFNLPGMKILQFAFDSDDNNPYLPQNHEVNSIVYTGTHDNNTTVGWINSLNEDQKQKVLRYLEDAAKPLHWEIIKLAFSSVADCVIIPLQDFLGLDEEHRMNIPGTAEGNWTWRFDWEHVEPNLQQKINQLNQRYSRNIKTRKQD